MIVGIEGPVLAGKSSLAARLVDDLACLDVPALSCPCYVEMARRLGRPVPQGLQGSTQGQLRALRFFLEIDRLRRCRTPSQGGLVLLDRTTWTLEAHAAALFAVGALKTAVDIDEPTRRAIHALRPDALVYLDVPRSVQLERAPSRDVLPPPFLEAGFNVAFRAFFDATAADHGALWLDATRPLRTAAASVVDYLRTVGAIDGQARPGPTVRCHDEPSPGTESCRCCRG